MKKKTLSLALALAMCLGLMAPAFAEEIDEWDEPIIGSVYEDGEDSYLRITNAISQGEADLFFGVRITCDAPAEITLLKPIEDFSVYRVVDDEESEELSLSNVSTYVGTTGVTIIDAGATVTLTEPGVYTVYTTGDESDTIKETSASSGNSGAGIGSGNGLGSGVYGMYQVNVRAGSTPAEPEQPSTPARTAAANPSNDKLTADGAVQDPTVYKINDSNYFKIRDLAAILNGTSKQFSVGYDAALSSVTAATGQGYDKQPGDLSGAPAAGEKTAEISNDTIYVDGVKVEAEVYKIEGNNYFKLRDLGKALNFYVGWSAEQGVYIETDKGYSE